MLETWLDDLDTLLEYEDWSLNDEVKDEAGI
jgi:hypothetical protein